VACFFVEHCQCVKGRLRQTVALSCREWRIMLQVFESQ
jgi:hypothetical protein